VWIDIPIQLLGWQALAPMTLLIARRLKYKDPRVVKLFKTKLERLLSEQKLIKQLDLFSAKHSGKQLAIGQQ